MVKIAVAGGTGNVATTLLQAPIRSGHHEITIFTRKEPSNPQPGVSYKVVDYHNLNALTEALKGFHTVLSFLVAHLDVNNVAQKNLIHASITAGVSRFAPSEWSIASNSPIPQYANKDTIASYLAELQQSGALKKMQYCLFQPSVFMDYFAHPYPLNPILATWPFFLDFANRRAVVLDGGDDQMVITAASDVSEMLALALDDEREWPKVGGIRGCVTSINELLTIGRKVRPGEWQVENVKSEDVERGELKTSWVPRFDHPVIPEEEREAFSKEFVLDFFRALKRGAWMVGKQWNERFPEYKFIGPEEYLTKAWQGKA